MLTQHIVCGIGLTPKKLRTNRKQKYRLFVFCQSIPLDIALRLASLVPLQILQDAGRRIDLKVIILIASEGRDAGRHGEAVQVSRDVESSLRDLFRIEVIA